MCGFIDTGISKLPNGCDVPAEDPNLPKVEWRVTSVRTSGRFPSPVDALLTKNKTTVSQVVQGIGVMSFCWGYLTDKAMNLPAAIVITTTSIAIRITDLLLLVLLSSSLLTHVQLFRFVPRHWTSRWSVEHGHHKWFDGYDTSCYLLSHSSSPLSPVITCCSSSNLFHLRLSALSASSPVT